MANQIQSDSLKYVKSNMALVQKFKEMDKNGDGKIDRAEAQKAGMAKEFDAVAAKDGNSDSISLFDLESTINKDSVSISKPKIFTTAELASAQNLTPEGTRNFLRNAKVNPDGSITVNGKQYNQEGLQLYANGQVKSGFLAKDTKIDGINYAVDYEVSYHPNGKVEKGYTGDESVKFGKGKLELNGIAEITRDEASKVVTVSSKAPFEALMRKQPVQVTEFHLTPGGYYEYTLAAATEIELGGQKITLPEGAKVSAIPGDDGTDRRPIGRIDIPDKKIVSINGVDYKQGVALYDNGQVLRGRLAADTTINGEPLMAGSVIEYNKGSNQLAKVTTPEGRILKSYDFRHNEPAVVAAAKPKPVTSVTAKLVEPTDEEIKMVELRNDSAENPVVAEPVLNPEIRVSTDPKRTSLIRETNENKAIKTAENKPSTAVDEGAKLPSSPARMAEAPKLAPQNAQPKNQVKPNSVAKAQPKDKKDEFSNNPYFHQDGPLARWGNSPLPAASQSSKTYVASNNWDWARPVKPAVKQPVQPTNIAQQKPKAAPPSNLTVAGAKTAGQAIQTPDWKDGRLTFRNIAGQTDAIPKDNISLDEINQKFGDGMDKKFDGFISTNIWPSDFGATRGSLRISEIVVSGNNCTIKFSDKIKVAGYGDGPIDNPSATFSLSTGNTIGLTNGHGEKIETASGTRAGTGLAGIGNTGGGELSSIEITPPQVTVPVGGSGSGPQSAYRTIAAKTEQWRTTGTNFNRLLGLAPNNKINIKVTIISNASEIAGNKDQLTVREARISFLDDRGRPINSPQAATLGRELGSHLLKEVGPTLKVDSFTKESGSGSNKITNIDNGLVCTVTYNITRK